MKDFIITSNGNLINYSGKNACNATITSHYIIITLYIKIDAASTTSHSVHQQDDVVRQQMNNQIQFLCQVVNL